MNVSRRRYSAHVIMFMILHREFVIIIVWAYGSHVLYRVVVVEDHVRCVYIVLRIAVRGTTRSRAHYCASCNFRISSALFTRTYSGNFERRAHTIMYSNMYVLQFAIDKHRRTRRVFLNYSSSFFFFFYVRSDRSSSFMMRTLRPNDISSASVICNWSGSRQVARRKRTRMNETNRRRSPV